MDGCVVPAIECVKCNFSIFILLKWHIRSGLPSSRWWRRRLAMRRNRLGWWSTMRDLSNGYEPIAAESIARRGARPGVGIGVRQVRDWAATIKPGGAVLDLGCGPGYPITSVLVETGLAVHAV